MPGGECGTQRSAGIARRRLDPDIVEMPVLQDLAIGHAIERHASGQTQVLRAVILGEAFRHAPHDDLGHILDRGGEIHVVLGEQLIGASHRQAEQRSEAVIGHAQAGAIVEIGKIETERTVLLHVDQLVENRLREARPAIRRKAHDLVLAGIDLEPGVIGEGGIEQAERMRKLDLAIERDGPAASHARRCRRPLADPVHGQDRRFREWRRIEGARRMALVMFGKKQAVGPFDIGRVLLQFIDEKLPKKQLFLQPQRHRLGEGRIAARREGEIGLDQTFEFDEGLLVKDDMVALIERDAALRET